MVRINQDNAGKTTLLYRLKVRKGFFFTINPILCLSSNVCFIQIGEVVTTIPTIGFNVESVAFLPLCFEASTDPTQIRHIWEP